MYIYIYKQTHQQTERQACRYKYVCLKTHGDDCCSRAPLEYQLKACAPILSRSTPLSVLVLLLYFPSCAHNLARARAISRAAICLYVYKCTQVPGATERIKLWCLAVISCTTTKKLSLFWVCFVSPQYVVLRAPNADLYISESPSD